MTDFIPPWMDMPTLCKHISCSPNTIDAWVAQGILPPPRKRGGKQLWLWSEVHERLINGKPVAETDIERVQNGTRRAAAEARDNH